MENKILKIGNRPMDAMSLVDIGKGSFVLARTAINHTMCMFSFFPTAIHLMHHSIEVFIKVFLVHENIEYNFGRSGHKLIDLLEIGYSESSNLSFFQDKILCRADFVDVLKELDKSYTDNKYSFPGYSIKSVSLNDLFDELTFTFLGEFCKLSNVEGKALEQLKKIDVPESFLYQMEYEQKQKFVFCLIPDKK